MAKYNLLEDDDIFDEKNDLSSEDEEKTQVSQETEEESEPEKDFNFDDEDLLEEDMSNDFVDHDFHDELELDDVSMAQKEPLQEIDDHDIDDSEEEPEFVSYDPQKEEIKKEPAVDSEKPYITKDYADEKSPGLNYKPLIIGGVAILVLFFAWIGYNWMSSDSQEEMSDTSAIETQQPAKTAQQLLEEQTAARKKTFLTNIAGKTTADIQVVNSAIQNASNSAKISSILLYDKSLLFEVFGSDREEVARVSMALKQKMNGPNFNVVSSQIRPGSNGGVFGLFKADLGSVKPGGGAANAGQVNFNSVSDAESWLKTQSAANGLKIRTLQSHFTKNADDFQVFQVAATVDGSVEACKGLLQKISSDGSQIKIHKLNLLAADQKSFTSKNYQLKLVLEIFV